MNMVFPKWDERIHQSIRKEKTTHGTLRYFSSPWESEHVEGTTNKLLFIYWFVSTAPKTFDHFQGITSSLLQSLLAYTLGQFTTKVVSSNFAFWSDLERLIKERCSWSEETISHVLPKLGGAFRKGPRLFKTLHSTSRLIHLWIKRSTED